MIDCFDSPKEVLSRARDHIEDLNARVQAFFDRKPYARVVDYDRETGQDVHKIRLTAQLPGKIAAVAKDALSNLRDALDHAVYASAVALSPGFEPSRTAFPFAENASGVHDKLNRELLDIPPEIRTLLEGFRPHKTGNQLLWGLCRTRNVKTHRILVPLGTASTGTSLGLTRGRVIGPAELGLNRWNPLKNEVEFLRVGRGSQLEYEVNVAFSVLFSHAEVLGGKEAIGTLHAISREVECILVAIETETHRLLT